MKIKIFLISAIFFFACNNKTKIDGQIENDKVRNFIENAKVLDDLFDIKEIALSVPNNVIIGNLTNLIRISDKGNVFLKDENGVFYKFNHEGKFVGRLHNIGNGPGEYSESVRFCVGKKGHLFIVDYFKGKVFEYDENLKYLDYYKIPFYYPIGYVRSVENKFFIVSPIRIKSKVGQIYNEKWELIEEIIPNDKIAQKYILARSNFCSLFEMNKYVVFSYSTKLEFRLYTKDGEFIKSIYPNLSFRIPRRKYGPFERSKGEFDFILNVIPIGNEYIAFKLSGKNNRNLWNIFNLKGEIIRKGIPEINYKGRFIPLKHNMLGKVLQTENEKGKIISKIIIYTLKNHEEK